MTDPRTHVAIYQRLTRLYPASFRDEYRLDLVALFDAQLRDERAVRVWLRAVRDLAVTVPAQQLEVRMDRPAGNVVTALFSVATVASLLLAVVFGSAPTALLFLSIALATGGIAFWSWSASRSARAPGGATQSWWKFLLVGSGLAVVTVIAVKVPWPEAIDLGDLSYWLVVVSGMTSITLVAFGILLAVGNMIRRHRPPRAGAPVA